MTSGRWKLYLPHKYRTLSGRSGGRDGKPVNYDTREITKPELYDLVADVGETHNVAADHPDEVSRLLALAEQSRDDLGDSLTGRKGKNVRAVGRLAGATE